ncbi:MAG: IclR family transcriptional regulator, partial [Thermoflexus sp.]|uniref:IclR family transcriptional regulator n=1 Tax=Thermoflexus sp. TaxID=1969742 RepID=UPI00331DA660
MSNNSRGGIRSVAKALQILEAFDAERRTLRVTDLAHHLGLPKSTVHGLLRTLCDHGFVQQLDAGRLYAPGPKLLHLATMVDRDALLVEAAGGPLRELAHTTEETAKLGVRVGLSVVVLHAVESPRVLHTRGDVGVAAPLYCTALGKALLAFLPPDEQERVLQAVPLRAYTPRTITGLGPLRQHLASVRARGYATDVQEHEPDVRCVGAPLLDLRGVPVAAVSVSGPAQRMP